MTRLRIDLRKNTIEEIPSKGSDRVVTFSTFDIRLETGGVRIGMRENSAQEQAVLLRQKTIDVSAVNWWRLKVELAINM